MNRTVLAYDTKRGSYVAMVVLSILLIFCCIGAASADASTVMKVVPGEISEGTLPVNILIEGLPQGQSLEGCNFKLTYNSDQLQFNDAVQYGNYLTGWTWYPTIKDVGFVEFSGAKFPSGTNPATSAGTLMTVTFNITGNGVAHFGISDIHLQDSSYVDLSVTPQGADKILGPSALLKVECGQITENCTLPVNILIEGLPQGQSLEGCNLKLTYDPNLLQYSDDDVEYSSFLPGWTWYPLIKGEGYIEFSGAKFPNGTNPAATAGTIFTAVFNVKGSGTANLGLTDVHFQDASYSDIAITTQDGTIVLTACGIVVVPSVESGNATKTTSTATLNGSITSNGGGTISEYGFYWGTTANPATKKTVGTNNQTGAYTASLSGLNADTTYYYKAFAKNEKGEAFGEVKSFKTDKVVVKPTVTTSAAGSITTSSALLNGNITSNGNSAVTEYGFYWGTSTNPSTKKSVGTNDQSGAFSTSLTGLNPNTTYYFKAYAKNTQGESFGDVLNFTTAKEIVKPTVTTVSAGNIDYGSATLNGTIGDNGGAPITDYGFYWGTTNNPATKVTLGTANYTGEINYELSGLTDGTKYYFKAYATNAKGTTFGSVLNFTTGVINKPAVTTSDASNVGTGSATLNGNITGNGGGAITEYGFYWGTTSNPTTKAMVGQDNFTGAISYDLSGLTDGKKYYFKAYATNAKGTTTGAVLNFTTGTVSKPEVTTADAGNVGTDSATLNGNITSNGGGAITEYGFYWGTSSNPTTKAMVGQDNFTGAISYDLSGLTDGKKYYFKAYAVNSKGTSTGAVLNFTTGAVNKPTVTTADAGNVDTDSAVLNGNITSSGGSDITEYGFYWGTNANPIVKQMTGTDNHNGAFSYELNGLTTGTTYYYKAYAKNAKGESIGEVKSFTTVQYQIDVTLSAYSDISDKRPLEISGTAPEEADWEVKITDAAGKTLTTYTHPTRAASFNWEYSPNLPDLPIVSTYTLEITATMESGEKLSYTKDFEVSNYDLKITEAKIEKSGSACTVTAKVVNLGSESETVQGICQVVSQNGTYLLDFTEQLTVGEAAQTLQFSFNNLNSGKYKVQVFIWANEDGTWITKGKPYPENLSDTLSFTI
ncbi:MAG: Fibronectin type III domain protein [Pelotomaculum sp. PtaB.Bin104]|nr:MAG: Fibronectin type III domain protein [Pelotomaculum sp. PtaB.Bin104]